MEYTPPTLKVVEVKVEQGFAASSLSDILPSLDTSSDPSYSSQGNESTSYGNETWSW